MCDLELPLAGHDLGVDAAMDNPAAKQLSRCFSTTARPVDLIGADATVVATLRRRGNRRRGNPTDALP